jgi:hypothetical protein
MRRIRAALAAATLLSLVMASSAVAGTSGVSTARLIAGTLRDAHGRPAAGRVLVFHDNLRDANRLELVASGKASGNGKFEVRLGSSKSVDAARARNDGYANFAYYGVTADGVSSMYFFPASLAPGAAWRSNRANLSASNIETVDAAPSPDFANRIATLLDQRAASSGGITPQTTPDEWLGYCIYDIVSTWDASTPVVQLHDRYSDLTGKVWYGKTTVADSDITVGIRTSGSWSLSGTTHTGTDTTIEASRTVTGTYGAVLSSSFKYRLWRFASNNYFACATPPAPHDIVESIRWNGTTFSLAWNDTASDGLCTTTFSAHKDSIDAGEYWARWNNAYSGFAWSLNVPFYAGTYVNMRSYSGASNKVGHEYTAGFARPTHWICGDNDFPAYSWKILAG